MRATTLLTALLLLTAFASISLAALPMRPYSGIGVLQLNNTSLNHALHLYEEPGLLRNGTLNPAAVRQFTDWLFGAGDDLHLLVTARKGEWLKVEHDDAGRESWLHAPPRGTYTPWELFLKGKEISFLRNAPRHQLQVYGRPGGAPLNPVTSTTPMRVILVQHDWCYVLFDQSSAGWIRWRDHDSRLLVGLSPPTISQSR